MVKQMTTREWQDLPKLAKGDLFSFFSNVENRNAITFLIFKALFFLVFFLRSMRNDAFCFDDRSNIVRTNSFLVSKRLFLPESPQWRRFTRAEHAGSTLASGISRTLGNGTRTPAKYDQDTWTRAEFRKFR
jgi:hypothetical protein